MALEAPGPVEGLGRVVGDDCSFNVAGAQTRGTSVRTALVHALEQREGATALIAVKVRQVVRAPYESCIEVEGEAVRASR